MGSDVTGWWSDVMASVERRLIRHRFGRSSSRRESALMMIVGDRSSTCGGPSGALLRTRSTVYDCREDGMQLFHGVDSLIVGYCVFA